MSVVSRKTAPHYVWGEGECDGWRLLDAQDLSVIEEFMPPGTAEVPHHHGKANQLFYVLEGTLTMCFDSQPVTLGAGSAINVQPGTVHQASNNSNNAVRFLVISAPTTNGDRFLS